MNEDLNDELPIFPQLDFDVHVCDCCGKSNLKRTVAISIPNGAGLNLGVICTGRWFNITMTGNPWYALDRLNRKLRTMDNDDIEGIVSEIKEAATKWQ